MRQVSPGQSFNISDPRTPIRPTSYLEISLLCHDDLLFPNGILMGEELFGILAISELYSVAHAMIPPIWTPWRPLSLCSTLYSLSHRPLLTLFLSHSLFFFQFSCINWLKKGLNRFKYIHHHEHAESILRQRNACEMGKSICWTREEAKRISALFLGNNWANHC